MTNVHAFPGKRQRIPVTSTDDDVRDQLASIELELARARLAQIKAETSQARTLWAWYCFKKILWLAVILWLVSVFAGGAKAQNQTTFRDSRGSTTGTAAVTGNTTTFRDAGGRTVGTASRPSR